MLLLSLAFCYARYTAFFFFSLLLLIMLSMPDTIATSVCYICFDKRSRARARAYLLMIEMLKRG